MDGCCSVVWNPNLWDASDCCGDCCNWRAVLESVDSCHCDVTLILLEIAKCSSITHLQVSKENEDYVSEVEKFRRR